MCLECLNGDDVIPRFFETARDSDAMQDSQRSVREMRMMHKDE